MCRCANLEATSNFKPQTVTGKCADVSKSVCVDVRKSVSAHVCMRVFANVQMSRCANLGATSNFKFQTSNCNRQMCGCE